MKNLLLTCALTLFSLFGWAQCEITYTYTTNGLSVTLDPADSSSMISYNVWNAPGGTPSVQQLYVTANASVTYSAAGTYQVCVIMYDSNWSCSDTFCDSITVTGGNIALAMTSTDDSCSTCNGSASVSASGGVAPYSYAWSNAATTSSVTSLCSGTYTVTVTDANSNTASLPVTIGNTTSLSAAITPSTTTPNCGDTVTLTASSNASSVTYLWSNGATTSSIQVNANGTYLVTITSVSGCTGVASHSVSYPSYSLSGFIAQGSPSTAYLIQQDAGVLTAISTFSTDSNGFYTFTNLCNGTYYVKGALDSTHTQYANYVPTYYDSAALWNNSTAIIINNGSATNINFSLLAGTNTGGPGFIGGLISQGANRPMGGSNGQGFGRGEGDPVANAMVIVVNASGDLSAFTRSDVNGNFSISDLAEGSYAVYVDILNKVSYPYLLEINANETTFDAVNFLVQSTVIEPQDLTGLEMPAASLVTLFPNPASDVINMTSSFNLQAVRVYNMLGELILTAPVAQSTSATLNIEALTAGTYIIETIGSSEIHRQIVTKR